MRTGTSIIKYLALVCLFSACVFDPKSSGGGSTQNPQTGDGATAGTDGTSGTNGAAAISGGDPGAAGASGSGEPIAGDDEPAPPPLLADGVACNADDRCMSGRCNGGICCEIGYNCCKRAADCATDGADRGKACDDRANCNGSAGKVTCDNQFRCATIDGAPDDTACDASVEAKDCGPYKPVYCSGAEVQDIAPECPTSCSSDDDCDPKAHCDGQCIDDLPTGQKCDEPSDCNSDTCGMNGICCGRGRAAAAAADCCSIPADCPASYSWAPRCDDQATCQGTSGEATCERGVCGTTMVQDDSACEGRTDCGPYAPVVCMKGRREQQPRGCATSCQADGNCNQDMAFCGNSRCQLKLDDGRPCDRDQQCETGCGNNKICCNGNECCVTAADCPPDEGTCTETCANGKRKVRECAENVCVTRSTTTDDDTACAGVKVECGMYNPPACEGTDVEEEQGCPTSCVSNGECDPGTRCVSSPPGSPGVCELEGVAGAGGAGGASGAGGAGGASGDGGPEGP